MSKLKGLSTLELGRLRVSLGYGTHKKGRPLSPVEVGTLLRRACDGGHTLAECAEVIRIDGTGLARFLRILELPEELRHLVDWGGGSEAIGFSCAAELVRVGGEENQRVVGKAVLEHGLSSKEVRQVGQLVRRSGRSVDVCLREVLGMRPRVEKRYVFIGSVSDKCVQEALKGRPQRVRDAILAAGVVDVGLRNAAGRLGTGTFTLVGDEGFEASMKEVGKGVVEQRLRAFIAGAIGE